MRGVSEAEKAVMLRALALDIRPGTIPVRNCLDAWEGQGDWPVMQGLAGRGLAELSPSVIERGKYLFKLMPEGARLLGFNDKNVPQWQVLFVARR
ncbi:MAG: hypothetical protein HZB23_03420 [Deltaproteobacteria bacterium]|nr:hypothetical protein [Deltaproteobacteria bacterium]